MKTFSALVGAFLIPMIIASYAIAEPKELNKEQAEKLITGNTVEGVDTKWNKKMIWYFKESGKLKRLDDRGQKSKADWHIDSRGMLCVTDKGRKQEKCNAIVPRDDGGYDVVGRNWRWEKVTPGNPENL